MKKLARAITLVVLLLGVFLFTNPSSSISSPPELHSISFDKTLATGGDQVLLSLNITDDLDEVNYVYVDLYWENSTHNFYINSYYPSFNSNTQFWESTILVGQYWDTGFYYINYIYVEDKDGNSINLNDGSEYTSPRFEVSGTTPDSQPPILENLWFSQSSATANDSVALYAKVTDDISGVDYVYAEIYWYNSTGLYGTYELGSDLQENGTDIYAFTFIVGQYWKKGTYYVNYMQMRDIAGNYISLYNSSGQIPITELYVSGTTPDFSPPQVHSVSLNPTAGTPGDEITVTANVTDDVSGVSYVSVELYWYNQSWVNDWDHLYILYLDLYSSGVKDLYTNSFIVNQYWRSGTYFIKYAYAEDNAYNWESYRNGTDFFSGELEVSGTTPDTEPPIFHSIFTNADSSSAGSYFNVFINASDSIAGIQDGWVEFDYFNTTDSLWYYATSGWLYYNSETQLLEGQLWTPDNENLIGLQITSNYLEIYDKAGNSLYLDAQNGDFSSVSIEITPRQKTGFNLSIEPNEGSSNVGEAVPFAVFMESLFSYNVEGKLSVTVTGAETFDVFLGEIYNFAPSQSISRDFDITFSTSGDYEIKASLNVEGQVFLVIASWTVYEGAGEINISVDPSEGESNVNETVSFEVVVMNNFDYSIEDVTLLLEGSSSSGEEFKDEVMVSIASHSSISEFFEVSFSEIGKYTLRAVLIDSNGDEWSFEFSWNVVEGDSGDNDSLTEPEIELPGFELPLVLLSLTAMTLIITIRRKTPH